MVETWEQGPEACVLPVVETWEQGPEACVLSVVESRDLRLVSHLW